MKKIFFFIFMITFLKAEIENPQNPPKKMIKNLSLKNLEKLQKEHKYLMVGFVDNKSLAGKKIYKALKKLSKIYQKNPDIFFATINIRKLSLKSMVKVGLNTKNEIFFYLKSFPKKYTDKKKYKNIKNYLSNLLSTKVELKTALEDVHKVDSSYFIYIKEADYKKEEEKYDFLSKLIYPITIITGLKEKKFQTDKNTILSLYREYNKKVIKIPENSDLNKMAKFIIENEFPDFLELNEESLKMIFEYKLPSLIYFTHLEEDEHLEVLKFVAKSHKEYCLLLVVNTNFMNDELLGPRVRFLMNFMKIEHSPSLRILNLQNGVRRYKFVGNFEANLFNYFFENYLQDNLKSYFISEDFPKPILDVKKANFLKLNKLLKNKKKDFLIYIYSGYKQEDSIYETAQILSRIQKRTKLNNNFQIYIIDHDKNDIDGHFNDEVPFLFISKKGKIKEISGDVTDENVIAILKNYLDDFKVEDFEEEEVTDL